MMRTYHLYVYAENCAMKGQVYVGDDAEGNGDLQEYGDGTREGLIQQAVDSLGKRYDMRPGGAGDSFRWTCDRNVLEYLNGPKVEYNEAIRAYSVVE